MHEGSGKGGVQRDGALQRLRGPAMGARKAQCGPFVEVELAQPEPRLRLVGQSLQRTHPRRALSRERGWPGILWTHHCGEQRSITPAESRPVVPGDGPPRRSADPGFSGCQSEVREGKRRIKVERIVEVLHRRTVLATPVGGLAAQVRPERWERCAREGGDARLDLTGLPCEELGGQLIDQRRQAVGGPRHGRLRARLPVRHVHAVTHSGPGAAAFQRRSPGAADLLRDAERVSSAAAVGKILSVPSSPPGARPASPCAGESLETPSSSDSVGTSKSTIPSRRYPRSALAPVTRKGSTAKRSEDGTPFGPRLSPTTSATAAITPAPSIATWERHGFHRAREVTTAPADSRAGTGAGASPGFACSAEPHRPNQRLCLRRWLDLVVRGHLGCELVVHPNRPRSITRSVQQCDEPRERSLVVMSRARWPGAPPAPRPPDLLSAPPALLLALPRAPLAGAGVCARTRSNVQAQVSRPTRRTLRGNRRDRVPGVRGPSSIAASLESDRVTLEGSWFEPHFLLMLSVEHAGSERVTKEAERLAERAACMVGIELRPEQRHDRVPAARGVMVVSGEVNE